MTAQSWDELNMVAWGELRHNYGTAEDVPGLLQACAGPDAELASEAARKLDSAVFHQGGWICPAAPAVLPFLVTLAADPGNGIRVEVVELITNLAHEAVRVPAKHVDPAWRPAINAAAPSLLRLLEDSAASVRRAAVYLAGVGGLDVEGTLDALRARLAAEPETGIRYDIIVSMAAAVAANRESDAARDVQRALTAMAAPGTEDPQVRLAAVHGLAELGEPAERHLPLLTQATTDPGTARWQDSAWFGSGAGLVARTGELLTDNPGAALDYSVGVSQRGDAAQRTAAIDRVAVLAQEWRTIGDGLLPYLASELTAGEEEVRFPAAYLLGALGQEAVAYADQVAVLVGDDTPVGLADDTVSDAAVWALTRFGDARATANLRLRFTSHRLGFPVQSTYQPRHPLLPWLSLPHVSAVVRAADPRAELLDAVTGWMRAAGDNPAIAAQFCEIVSGWGEKAAAAVPELRRVLGWAEPARFPGPAAAKALGTIGPEASAASGELRRHAAAGSHLAAWALWRVSGDESAAAPLLASAADEAKGETGRGVLLRYLPDFGPLAAPLEGRLRELLQAKNDWARAEAAQALWRITGDAAAAVPVLASLTAPLREGRYLPVTLAAMRYLAGIPGATALAPEIAETARTVLANPRRLASSGAWRAFTEDDDIRAAAAEFVTG